MGRLDLTPADGLDSSPEYLGHISPIVDAQGNNPIVFNVPLVTLGHTVYHLPDWMTLLTAAFGVGLATATMHLARWTGKIHGKFAKALLVSD
jgi:hypothetical protein